MIKIIIIFLTALFSPIVLAIEMTEADTGTYTILKKDRTPTGMFYRLSKNGEKWMMEGKKSAGQWQDLSCEKGCEYRQTTSSEITGYFPTDWRENSDIACIQNVAQAFCKVSKKDNPSKVLHLVIALVAGKPTPIFLRRENTK